MSISRVQSASAAIAAAFAIQLLAGLHALAQSEAPPTLDGPLPKPTGEVILTLTGAIERTNTDDGEAEFDLAMLQAMPQRSLSTSTPWTEGVSTFTGPALADLIDVVGGSGEILHAYALNDYEARIPVADITPDLPLLAILRDGHPMSVRDYGPIRVMFPYDDGPQYRTELRLWQSIWQVHAINVE